MIKRKAHDRHRITETELKKVEQNRASMDVREGLNLDMRRLS